MATKKTRWGHSIVLALIAAVLVACSTLSYSDGSTTAPQEDRPAGAELWAQNCRRCHNFRDPTSLSDAQWDVVMMHMRIRANLTAEEHQLILEYLKSSNG